MTTIIQISRSSTLDRGDLRSGEELRDLLCRLHKQGPGAWGDDPAVPKLMEYVCEKYAALAKKYGLDPWEAASAAFDVMRTRAAREARDPWAVITHAVRITCIYEERAQGLLCSVHQARRPRFAGLHDPERFSTRTFPLTDDHPSFSTHLIDEDDAAAHDKTKLLIHSVIEHTIELVMLLGWPSDAARHSVEHICDCLADAGSPNRASEALRRERHVRALLDVSARSWLSLVHGLLGRPGPQRTVVSGRGVLLRFLLGETIPTLLSDDDLVRSLAFAAPGAGR